MQKKGVDIEVFAFYKPHQKIVHPEVGDVKSIHYFSNNRAEKIYGHFYWFFHRPFTYVKTAAFAFHPRSGIGRLFLENLYDAMVIDNRRPDHIHAHWPRSTDFALLVHLLTGISFSFTTHRYEIFDRPGKNYRIKSKLAKKHVTVTEYNRRYIMDHFGVDAGDITVIHSALDFTKTYPVADCRGKNTLVSVARLEKVKNLDALIHACAILKGENIPFECLIVGDGSEKAHLEGLIRGLNLSGEVRLLGYKKQEEVFELLGRAKLLILTSRSEGWPNVFTEAWACRVPVIGPDVTGVPEILHDGVDGFIVEPDDVGMLVEKIKILLTNEPLRERFIENGYKKAFEQFNIDTESGKLLAVWQG